MSRERAGILVLGLFFALMYVLVGLLLWKLDVGAAMFRQKDGWLWMGWGIRPVRVAPDTPEGRRTVSRAMGLVFLAAGGAAAVATLIYLN